MARREAMTRERFIERAPLYYALAIVFALKENEGPMTEQELRNTYSVKENPEDEYSPSFSLLRRESIFAAAITWLENRWDIDVIRDDFAHDLITASSNPIDSWNDLTDDKTTPFYRFQQGGQKRSFIQTSLERIDADYEKLNIKDDDFSAPQMEWAPIKLDPNDAEVVALADRVDEVIESVRGVNNYPAAALGERNFNLDSLAIFARRLRDDAEFTVAALRTFAIEPMNSLLKRFADTAIGVAVLGLKEAFKEVVKKYGKDMFEHIARAFTP